MIEDKIIEELKSENEKLISNVNLHLAKNFELYNENKKLKKQNETLQQELFNLYLKHYN